MDEKTAPSADLNYTAPSDVECDVCTGRKRKAEQSCLECVSSFCESHIDLHKILYVGKRHKLVAAMGSLKESICPKHGKLMEIFCRKDQQCICHLCITNKHKNHDVVLSEEEVPENKPPRVCDVYWTEFKHCKSLLNRFHHYYTYGTSPICLQWKDDYEACREWETNGSPYAKESLQKSERNRLSEQKNFPSFWEMRQNPPADWHLPLNEDKLKDS